jgi:hypothetical protein
MVKEHNKKGLLPGRGALVRAEKGPLPGTELRVARTPPPVIPLSEACSVPLIKVCHPYILTVLTMSSPRKNDDCSKLYQEFTVHICLQLVEFNVLHLDGM